MGGVENLRAVLQAEIISIEKVSVPPHVEILGVENGHVKTSEVGIVNWHWGMRLTVEKGPIDMPTTAASRIKNLLRRPDIVPEYKLGCAYLPCYRIELKEREHTLEIFVMQTTGDFDVFRDGVRISSRTGDNRLIEELNALLEKSSKEPNKVSGPTAASGRWLIVTFGIKTNDYRYPAWLV